MQEQEVPTRSQDDERAAPPSPDATATPSPEEAIVEALFGEGGERTRLQKLHRACREAIGALCYYQGTAYMCLADGDFRIPDIDPFIKVIKTREKMLRMLVDNYDQVADLGRPGRAAPFFALASGRTRDEALATARAAEKDPSKVDALHTAARRALDHSSSDSSSSDASDSDSEDDSGESDSDDDGDDNSARSSGNNDDVKE
jgi:hypothetical protein